MAEIIGVVASAAGLLSLSIQIVDTTKKLKARSAAIKGLPETIEKIEHNLEFLRFFLSRVEELSNLPAATTDARYELLLSTCLADYSAVFDVLKRLERGLERGMSTKASRLRRLLAQGDQAIVTEIRSLDQLERRAYEHITLVMLALVDNKITATVAQTAGIQPGPTEDGRSDGLDYVPAEMVMQSVLRSPKISYCGVRHCHCSCHAKKTFWAFRYTPLGAIFRACDRESCNARRYQFSVQIQLSWLGIPISMVVGGEIITGAAGFSIKPVLGGVQRVVKATSMGFRTLVRLEHDDIDIQEAKETLRQLYRSDPTFKTHVNPQGRTYLQELVRCGPWGEYGHRNDLQLELLTLFVDEFRVKSGIDTPEFILEVAGWGCESAHLVIVDTLVRLGQSFEDTDDPLFTTWPEPCTPRSGPWEMYGAPNFEAQDPFYIGFVARIVDLNEGFGGTHPLHQAVCRRNTVMVKEWVVRLGQRIHAVSNFLGQTPMHAALAPESSDILNLLVSHVPALIDVPDKWGFTPLTYALAMGYGQAASLLIKKGASLTSRSNWRQLDFVECAFQWNKEDLIWDLLQDIEASPKGPFDVWARLAEQTRHVVKWLTSPMKKRWIDRFWETLLSTPDFGNRLNMVFGDNGSTLGHLLRTVDTTQRLIDVGFTRYNYRDKSGKHCLFPASKSLNSQVVGALLAAGTRADIRDHKGKTCLHKVVKKIGRIMEPEFAEVLAVFTVVRLLLSASRQQDTEPLASITDDCHCPCSENGHLASDQLSAQFQDMIMIDAISPLWVVEYLSTLEDANRGGEARQSILAQLRLWKFSRLGIPHRCRCFGGGEEEDRPWDIIEDEKKIEGLEAEMVELRQLSLDNLKLSLVSMMRESYEALKVEKVMKAQAKEKKRRRNPYQQFKTKHLPKVAIDETKDQVLTRIDLLFRHRELLDNFFDGLDNYRTDPLQIVYKYMEYIAILGGTEEMQADCDRINAILRVRLEWVVLFLWAMDLPGFPEVFEGWKQRREQANAA
ncbi:hypothetical protein MFIFM68171_10211 [Madurella fahalii]|uniref:Fungal N-terminal domain-containing protein n=1 Tax=Madurella fahalii TaxID=1157608 RepID=A0ABQ0GQI1_9PEZI